MDIYALHTATQGTYYRGKNTNIIILKSDMKFGSIRIQ